MLFKVARVVWYLACKIIFWGLFEFEQNGHFVDLIKLCPECFLRSGLWFFFNCLKLIAKSVCEWHAANFVIFNSMTNTINSKGSRKWDSVIIFCNLFTKENLCLFFLFGGLIFWSFLTVWNTFVLKTDGGFVYLVWIICGILLFMLLFWWQQGLTSTCRSYGGRNNPMLCVSCRGWGVGSTANSLPLFVSPGLLAPTRLVAWVTRQSR